ncbi:MAG TPA: ribulose-phosphate 3-epimerase, partial [Candidatus Binatus sp.]|nr:ribulose-phosphate 3-epimerase [Candidatus Binatus sp.]
MNVKIAPSILAADQANLAAEVKRVEGAGADMIHVDVTDGHFAPNISMGPDTVRSLRRITTLPLDVHLMIEEPGMFLESFLEVGSDIVTVHAEVVDEKKILEFAKTVHSEGKRIGLALKPATPIPSWFKSQSRDLDLLLILCVNPGFAGQKFMTHVLPKLHDAITFAGRGNGLEIEVDGGVDQTNAGLIAKSGASILVAGASIFQRNDVENALRELRHQAEKAT